MCELFQAKHKTYFFKNELGHSQGFPSSLHFKASNIFPNNLRIWCNRSYVVINFTRSSPFAFSVSTIYKIDIDRNIYK